MCASACPITIHALLHIAGSIRTIGPVWAYWAFPMERHCGEIKRCIKSRRHPYKSIDTYVTSQAHVAQIKLLYDLCKELSFRSDSESNDFNLSSCESYPYISLN